MREWARSPAGEAQKPEQKLIHLSSIFFIKQQTTKGQLLFSLFFLLYILEAMKTAVSNRRIAIITLLSSVCKAAHAFTPFLSQHRQFSFRTTALTAAITLDGETLRGPIAPVGNSVLVRNKDTLSATAGGILLPDQVSGTRR